MSTRAVRRIERLLRRGNTSALCRATRHRDPLVRRRAIKALGELAEPGSVPCLGRALEKETDSWARQWAIEGLAAIGTGSAIDVLTRYMFHTDRELSQMAARTVRNHPSARAQAAIFVFDVLTRNAFDDLHHAGPEATRVLEIVAQSDLFQSWPTAKRKKVLDLAVARDVTPDVVGRKDLADMGVFVSGTHTVNDLLEGLKSRKEDVRVAAAEQLGASGVGWVKGTLFRNLTEQYEAHDTPNRFEIALARALEQMGDTRAVAFYEKHLGSADDDAASHAAEALAHIETPNSLKALFRFALTPPAKRIRYRVPLALAALEKVGPAAVAHLEGLLTHEASEVRRLMVSVILYSQHPHTVDYLTQLAHDDHADVQRTAMNGLVDLNTEEAATALYVLLDDVPREWVLEALSAVTHPAGADYLKRAVPDATILKGIVLNENGSPLAGARVQLVLPDETGPAGWRALTEQATTQDEGHFTLALRTFPTESALHLKLIAPQGGKIYYTELRVQAGRQSRVEIRINTFFDTLGTWVDIIPE